MKNIAVSLSVMLMMVNVACKDLVDVDSPSNQLIRRTVFQDDLTATAAAAGMYLHLSNLSGLNGITYLASLSSDEMQVAIGEVPLQFYSNELLSVNSSVSSLWTEPYVGIYRANSVIEGLQASDKISTSLKNQLIGEAKFFRAFHHFNLVNLFGDVPYVTTTDYRINGVVTREAKDAVYDKIIADLLDAKLTLADTYAFAGNNRVRVNKWAAAALLARVYLYKNDWIHAEEQANSVIDKNSLYQMPTLEKVFLKNSNESIWQLMPPIDQKYTSDGGSFIVALYNPSSAVMTEGLFKAFELNDQRQVTWTATQDNGTITWHYPFKYKETYNNATGAEYTTVLRLAEQFLIRAEARAQQNKLVGINSAQSDINTIRKRAGLPNTSAATQDDLLIAIQQERRVELFTEWGHRWFDLKRTGKATPELSLIKTNWKSTDELYPVPYSETLLNPNIEQNPGY